MFRMYGRIVQILRYQSTSTELHPNENGEFVEENVTHYAPTQEEAAAFGENVHPLPLEADEWMDGLEVADVPDTMGEAVKIRDMGQVAYLALLKRQEQQAPESLHNGAACDATVLQGVISIPLEGFGRSLGLLLLPERSAMQEW